MATARTLNNQVRGLTRTSLTRLTGAGKQQLVLPNANGLVFNPGVEVQELTGKSVGGETVTIDRIPSTRAPVIALDWNVKTMELIAMALGLQLESATDVTAQIIDTFCVTSNTIDAAAAGLYGNGVAEDAASLGAFLNDTADDAFVEMTSAAFAGFDPAAATESYAVGADNALAFSDDLIGKYVSIRSEIALATARQLTEEANDAFELYANQILLDRSMLQWHFPEVRVQVDQTSINTEEQNISIAYSVVDDGSHCVPYSLTYLGKAQRVRCKQAA